MQENLKDFLDSKLEQYNLSLFINDDPISIPHRFTKKQDIEIAGFFAALLAWGNRKSIINSCNTLLDKMDNQPYQFILQHTETDLKKISGFKYRTFNDTDLFCLVQFLKLHYTKNKSLENAFSKWMKAGDETVKQALSGFHNYVFSNPEYFAERTRKHIATPKKKSACKRLNMFLRWMVREDDKGVDFGIWKSIQSSQLICPLDVHVARVARKLGILQRTQDDWLAAVELTAWLRELDASDPVKYDYALFSLGVTEKF